MYNQLKLLTIFLFACLALSGCNSLDREYKIVREIQEEGHAKDITELTPEKIAMSGFDNERNHIVKLHLSGQGMTILSSKIGLLKHLKRLEIDENQLSFLPDEIGALQSLEVLIASDNQLATLPETFSKLKSMKELILDNNPLKPFPRSILKIDSLQYLLLRGCPELSLPDAIVNSTKILSVGVDSLIIARSSERVKVWLSNRDINVWKLKVLEDLSR